jgi:hypothetical protein
MKRFGDIGILIGSLSVSIYANPNRVNCTEEPGRGAETSLTYKLTGNGVGPQ